ncbi:MAG: SEC-C domain-containing protein [Phycisphaerae bacterium]|nr:MAG: SEC-C domain-containing protein [Phycisphaerae bacterium]
MSYQQALRVWGVGELLRSQSGLVIDPNGQAALTLEGMLAFTARPGGLEEISDEYKVRIVVPAGFPRFAPHVQDLGHRVDRRYHTNSDQSLCLGSPVRLRMALTAQRPLLRFVEQCVIPYLYGYSYYERHGKPPFGELLHGVEGLKQEYESVFRVRSWSECIAMLALTGMRKQLANKRPCPCGSGRRLGRCHNRTINALRRRLGRRWCSDEARRLAART